MKPTMAGAEGQRGHDGKIGRDGRMANRQPGRLVTARMVALCLPNAGTIRALTVSMEGDISKMEFSMSTRKLFALSLFAAIAVILPR